MSQKTVRIAFFTDLSVRNLSFPEFQGDSIPWSVFSTQACNDIPMFSPFLKIFFFTKTGFSIHISDSSVNFTWFALLSLLEPSV